MISVDKVYIVASNARNRCFASSASARAKAARISTKEGVSTMYVYHVQNINGLNTIVRVHYNYRDGRADRPGEQQEAHRPLIEGPSLDRWLAVLK